MRNELSFKHPSAEQVEALLESLQPHVCGPPGELIGCHGDYVLIFACAEDDFGWSVSVKGAGDESSVAATIAGSDWSESREEARRCAEYWLKHGHYPE